MTDPRIGPVYLGKVDLADAYMRLWVRLEDTPSMTFLIPSKTPTNKQLFVFHLYLPMGYVDNTPFFCLSMETIKDMANAAMDECHMDLTHPLEVLANSPALEDRPPMTDDKKQWTQTSPDQRGHTLDQVDAYLDGFISTRQGGPTER